jgi:hypothetical protein
MKNPVTDTNADPTSPPASRQLPSADGAQNRKPIIPAGISECYVDVPGSSQRYVARVLGSARLHFVNAAAAIDVWQTRHYLAPISDDGQRPEWTAAEVLAAVPRGQVNESLASYLPPPAVLLRAENYKQWRQQLASYVYESASIEVLQSSLLKGAAGTGSNEAEFRAHLALTLREKRDAAMDALRRKYAAKVQALQDQIRRAHERAERERSQLSQQKISTAISVGTSILGALFGRRGISAADVGRVGTAARSAGRIGRESQDVDRADDSVEVLQQRQAELEQQIAADTAALQQEFSADSSPIERVQIKARKSDIDVTDLGLAWIPLPQ